MKISFFKNSTNNGGKFISHGGMIAEFLRCPAHTLQNLITGCYERMKFSKELLASVVCWAKEEYVCTDYIYKKS